MADTVLGLARVSYLLKKKVSAKEKAVVRTLLDEVCETIPDPTCDSISLKLNH